jgi:hypothetical protein
MSNLKSPFNQDDTPAPVEVSLDETPWTGLTRHAKNLYDNLYHNHPINEGMEFNGLQSPNHDPLMPIPESPAVTNCTVNFKINDNDDSNTPICKFNFGEKEHPYPRFNVGIDNIATDKSLRHTYKVHPDTNQVHPVHAPAPATLPHDPIYTQVDPAYAHAHPQPPLYQKSSPNVPQESHPHDVWPYRPSTTTNQDYDEALQRGIMERNLIMAYCGNPPDYPNQADMLYASGPYTLNLIPNPHYSAHRAVEEYHRMHPSQNARDLAMGYWSPSGPNPSHVLPVNPTVKGKMKGP